MTVFQQKKVLYTKNAYKVAGLKQLNIIHFTINKHGSELHLCMLTDVDQRQFPVN